jgi:hypothetical protein
MASERIEQQEEKSQESYRSLDSASGKTQKTARGVDIPVPPTAQFFDDLEKASRKKD